MSTPVPGLDVPAPTSTARDSAVSMATTGRFDSLLWLARLHFGLAATFMGWDAAAQSGTSDVDGVADSGLPMYVQARIRREFEMPGTMFVASNTQAQAEYDAADEGEGRPITVEWPGFYVAGAVRETHGRLLGAICLFDATGATITLDDGRRAFLHELTTLASQAIGRQREEGRLRQRNFFLETARATMMLALTGSGTGVWDRDVVKGEIHYSPAWKAILGYGEHELSNRIEDAYGRLHPDDREHVTAAMQAHFTSQTDMYAVEHRIRCKDGSYKWISSRGKVTLRDSSGAALRMVGTTTDITALRELAAQLQQANDLMTNLTDQVPGLVFQYQETAAGQGRFTYASAGIREIYELTPSDVSENVDAIDALLDPRDLPTLRRSLRESAEKLTPWRLEYRVMLPKEGMRWRTGDARPQRLPDGGTVWHGFITDSTERKQFEVALHALATIDHLTQLPNRRHFMLESEAILTSLRGGHTASAAVLIFDLDHFKVVNDRWGHAVGDRALQHFASILRAEARDGDLLGRLGGEEFTALLPNTDSAAAVAFARRIQRHAADAPLVEGEDRIVLQVSVGIDSMRADDIGSYQSIDRSDKALYLAKRRGRNRVEVFGAP